MQIWEGKRGEWWRPYGSPLGCGMWMDDAMGEGFGARVMREFSPQNASS